MIPLMGAPGALTCALFLNVHLHFIYVHCLLLLFHFSLTHKSERDDT